MFFFVDLPMNFACLCINFAVAMVTWFCYYGNREGVELSVADTSGSERRQEECTLLMALKKIKGFQVIVQLLSLPCPFGHCGIAHRSLLTTTYSE